MTDQDRAWEQRALDLLEPFHRHQLWVQHAPGGRQLKADGATYDRLDLSKLDLREAELTNCTLHHANLAGADLSRAHLEDCAATFADLGGARLIRTTLTGSDLRGARFARANLIGSRFSRDDLQDCDFRDADLTGCRWHANGLRSADFRGANLAGAEIRSCGLQLADLTDVLLDRVILEYSELGEAYLRGAHGTLMALPIDVGTPEQRRLLEGEEALDWLLSAGADVRWMAPPPPPPAADPADRPPTVAT